MNIPHTDRWAYIRQRLADVRFPIADLIDKTGFDRGNISKMWNKHIPISDGFWEAFVKAYGTKAVKLPQENEIIKKLDLIIKLLKSKK